MIMIIWKMRLIFISYWKVFFASLEHKLWKTPNNSQNQKFSPKEALIASLGQQEQLSHLFYIKFFDLIINFHYVWCTGILLIDEKHIFIIDVQILSNYEFLYAKTLSLQFHIIRELTLVIVFSHFLSFIRKSFRVGNNWIQIIRNSFNIFLLSKYHRSKECSEINFNFN